MSTKVSKIIVQTIDKNRFKVKAPRSFEYDERVEAMIKELETLSIKELQQKWKEVTLSPIVPKWNRSFFIPRLAQMIQEFMYMRTLSKEILEKLNDIYQEDHAHKNVNKRNIKRHQYFAIGQKVEVTINKETKVFTVLRNGYLYENNYYKYLANLIKVVTGKKMSVEEFLSGKQ